MESLKEWCEILSALPDNPICLEGIRMAGGCVATAVFTWLVTRLRRNRKAAPVVEAESAAGVGQKSPPPLPGAPLFIDLPKDAEFVPTEPYSPALAAFLMAIDGEKASYSPADRELTAPGVTVTFAEGGRVLSILVTDQLLDLPPLLSGGWEGHEFSLACASAVERRRQVAERDRRAANEGAAVSLARASRLAALPGELPGGRPGMRLVHDGRGWVEPQD